MKKTFVKGLALGFLGSLVMAGSAMALPMMEIDGTGASTVALSDTDSDGIISWSGQLGVFDFALSAGVTKPQDGSASVPIMHLNGMATTDLTGTFTVKFTETDFGPMASGLTGFISSMNGLGGVQSLDVYYDTSNVAWGMGTQIADIDIINTSEIFNGIPISNPFSMTMIASFDLTDGSASFDDGVNPVPEPATMLLFGTGLAGLATLRRRKANK